MDGANSLRAACPALMQASPTAGTARCCSTVRAGLPASALQGADTWQPCAVAAPRNTHLTPTGAREACLPPPPSCGAENLKSCLSAQRARARSKLSKAGGKLVNAFVYQYLSFPRAKLYTADPLTRLSQIRI